MSQEIVDNPTFLPWTLKHGMISAPGVEDCRQPHLPPLDPETWNNLASLEDYRQPHLLPWNLKHGMISASDVGDCRQPHLPPLDPETWNNWLL